MDVRGRIAGVDSLPPVSFQLATGIRPKLPVVFHFTTKRPNTTIFSCVDSSAFIPCSRAYHARTFSVLLYAVHQQKGYYAHILLPPVLRAYIVERQALCIARTLRALCTPQHKDK